MSDKMEIPDEILIEMSYVKMSQYRTKVLKSLKEDVKIPTEIAKDTDIVSNHISNTLKQLKDHDLVECLNPEARKGRLYRLTDEGKNVVEHLD